MKSSTSRGTLKKQTYLFVWSCRVFFQIILIYPSDRSRASLQLPYPGVETKARRLIRQ